ncbi:hypothetical protein AB0H42_05765 [Nocardia sp. NPDC050799]|uniref:hypothetical protein n=1 Tax=Nocardia sp. NPDC050799 TaxID=3154842 RepID=UPI0033E0399D
MSGTLDRLRVGTRDLRQQIWHRDALADPARGHIDPYRPNGERDLLRDNRHYEVVPLTFPRDGAAVFVEQRGWADCYVVGALNARAVNIVPPERPNDIPANLEEFDLNPKHVWAPVTLDPGGALEMRNPVIARGDSEGLRLEDLHKMNAGLHWVDDEV